MDLASIRACMVFLTADARRRARNDQRGMNTMEYAVIAVVVLAVAVIIVGVIYAVATDKISKIK